MDTLYSLLKIVSMMATGAFGVTALLTKYKDEKGKITPWGKLAIGGIVVSSTISLSMYLLETSRAKTAAEKAKAEAEATKHQLQVIQRNAETTATQQEKSLQEAELLKSDLKQALSKSNDIARNLNTAVIKLDKNAQTTSTILNADLNKLDFLEVTFILAADALSFMDEQGRPILSTAAQILLTDDARYEVDHLKLSPVTFELQRHQSRIRDLVFEEWYFRFFLYPSGSGRREYSGQVYTRQRDYGVTSFTISTTTRAERLGFGDHSGNHGAELLVTYTIPPDRIAGLRTYQDLRGKSWGVDVKMNSSRFRVRSVTMSVNGSIFSRNAQMSIDKDSATFSVTDSIGFYSGRAAIPANFYTK